MHAVTDQLHARAAVRERRANQSRRSVMERIHSVAEVCGARGPRSPRGIRLVKGCGAVSHTRHDLALRERADQLFATLKFWCNGDNPECRPIARSIVKCAQEFSRVDEHHRIVRALACMTDCRTFRVCAEDDRFIACAASLQILTLFGTRHTHCANP